MKYTLKDDFGPPELYDAFQMTSSDMKHHGDDPNWSGWPAWIQEAMKRPENTANSIWKAHENIDTMSLREYELEGCETEFPRIIRNTNWILIGKRGDLYLLENRVFKEDFMRF